MDEYEVNVFTPTPLEPRYADGTLYLQMTAFFEGYPAGGSTCRVHGPDGYRYECCCDCAGCCGAWDE